MRGTYIGNDRMLVDLAYGGMLLASASDLSLMPSLVTTGMIEPPLTQFFLDQVEPGQVVVDVGANIGYFTVLAAKLVGDTGRVVAFEANPSAVRLLKDNLAVNWLTGHDVRVEALAVSSAEGTVTLNASEKFLGDSSVNLRPAADNLVDDPQAVEVPAVTLDGALQDLPVIDLLKVDIEGGEFHAFTGMQRLLGEGRVRRVVFEWNRGMLGEDADRLLDLLRRACDEQGASLAVLSDEGGLIPVRLESLAELAFFPSAVLTF